MSSEDFLLEKYGPLMKLADVASLLGRPTGGFRTSLNGNSELGRKLKPTMVKLGKRVYFRTIQVTTALQLDAVVSITDKE